MRQVAAYVCLGIGGVMFALGLFVTFSAGGFNKAQSESAPFILIRVYEAVWAASLMISGAVLLTGGLIACRNGTPTQRP